MVPATRDPGQITTNPSDRMYGTVKGQYPEHVRQRRDSRLLEQSKDMKT
jgi:hypothetical protein